MLRMRRNRLALAAGLLLLLQLVLAPVGADAPSYTVQDLGTIDGLVPSVTGVNAEGEVAGFVNGNAGPRAVRFRDGAWSYVPGLESTISVANGINDHGDLTGYYVTADGLRAFRYVDATGLEPINPLPGGTSIVAMALNNNGEVVGYADTAAGETHAFRAPAGLPATDLGTLGGSFSLACGINDAGQVAGTSTLPDQTQHAVLIRADDSILDLTSLDGPTGSSAGCAIDALGRTAGWSTATGATHAFRYAGSLTDIDGFASTNSSAESTNSGATVGWFVGPDNLHAFVHTNADGAVDLNTRIPADAGWFLMQAKAVNASGQIVGQGLVAGEVRAFLLTPSNPPDHTAPTITSLTAIPSSITPPDKRMVPVTLSVSATDDRDPSPVCSLSSIDGPSADVAVTGALSGSVRAIGGTTYPFHVTCADASGNQAEAVVNVVVPPDRTPPVITGVNASPPTIWPPNNLMVTVTVTATATDDSGESPTCKLGNITSPGAPAADYSVTGPNAASVRAVGGRTYTMNAICTDAAGNYTWGSRAVTVLADTTAPTITSVSASPSSITPADNRLAPVTVAVNATDDVDGAPVCFLSGISSSTGAIDDSSITGPLTASLRAAGGRTYTLRVTCMDMAANRREGSVAIAVPADTVPPTITALSVTPWVIWPPNGKFVGVAVFVSATDNVDGAPQCGITSITATDPVAGDAMITGALTASVRAVRDADGSTRIYTIRVTCGDTAGNTTERAVDVTVTNDHPSKLSVRALLKRNRHLLAARKWFGLNQRSRGSSR